VNPADFMIIDLKITARIQAGWASLGCDIYQPPYPLVTANMVPTPLPVHGINAEIASGIVKELEACIAWVKRNTEVAK
jgi:hypothetical protein